MNRSINFSFSNPIRGKRLSAILITLILASILPSALFAHPLGNFSINRYSRLEVGAQAIHLTYIVDMAEIPAHQEQSEIKAHGHDTASYDGHGHDSGLDTVDQNLATQDGIGALERANYTQDLLATLQDNLHLQVDGSPIDLQLVRSELTFPPGQAELPTQRLEAQFVATLPDLSGTPQVSYQDDNYAGQLGWQEVIVQSAAGTKLLDSSVPTEDISQELRAYPDDLLQRPLAVNSAIFTFEAQPAPTRFGLGTLFSFALIIGLAGVFALYLRRMFFCSDTQKWASPVADAHG